MKKGVCASEDGRVGWVADCWFWNSHIFECHGIAASEKLFQARLTSEKGFKTVSGTLVLSSLLNVHKHQESHAGILTGRGFMFVIG
jgi:hypothetical protein